MLGVLLIREDIREVLIREVQSALNCHQLVCSVSCLGPLEMKDAYLKNGAMG